MVSFFKGIVHAASLALCLAGANCGEDGMKVKGDYPKLNQEIKGALEAKVLNLVENNYRIVEDASNYRPTEEDPREAISFRGVPKEFINYFVEFTQDEYKEKDILMPDLYGLKLSLLPIREVKDICGELSGGCYQMVGSSIVMPDTLGIREFFAIFSHELGHHLYAGNEEYPSVANGSYSAIKAYQFSKPLGSLMVWNMLSYSGDENFSDINHFYQMYVKAAIFAPVNLMDYYGDVEAAMGHLANTKMFTIESRLDEKLAGLEGQKDFEISFAFWDELLDSIYFEESITKQDRLHTVALEDAHEFVGYNKVLNYKALAVFSRYDSDSQGRYYALLEDFVVNGSFGNPYFRGHAVSSLTEKLAFDMYSSFYAYPVDKDSLYSVCKKIIDVNLQYPCHTADPYVCPEVVRDISEEHVDAYLNLGHVALSGDSARKREAERYAIGFLTKFYPGVDFINSNFAALESAMQEETNNYVPSIMVNAGATSYGHDDCFSERFFKAALAANCMQTTKGPSLKLCESEKYYARRYLEYLLSFGDCEE